MISVVQQEQKESKGTIGQNYDHISVQIIESIFTEKDVSVDDSFKQEKEKSEALNNLSLIIYPSCNSDKTMSNFCKSFVLCSASFNSSSNFFKTTTKDNDNTSISYIFPHRACNCKI